MRCRSLLLASEESVMKKTLIASTVLAALTRGAPASSDSNSK